MPTTTIEKYPELTVFPEVPGKRVWRTGVHRKKLSIDDWKRGPKVRLPDGIHILTVSENTPRELFDAASLLSCMSNVCSQHANGFLPSDYFDSAIAVVDGRVVGGVIADRYHSTYLRKVLGDESEPTGAESQYRPVIWYVWVHPVHRRRGVGPQLLEAIAAHFGRPVAEMGFWLPVFEEADAMLRSMGITEVAGCH